MSAYLLDTHTLLWAVGSPDRLSPRVREILEDPGTDVAMSAANTWEVSIKLHLGKLDLPPEFLPSLPRIRRRMRLGLLDITEPHTILAGSLEWEHRDPFDRMVVAQACLDGRVVLSKDPRFSDTAISRIASVIW